MQKLGDMLKNVKTPIDAENLNVDYPKASAFLSNPQNFMYGMSPFQNWRTGKIAPLTYAEFMSDKQWPAPPVISPEDIAIILPIYRVKKVAKLGLNEQWSQLFIARHYVLDAAGKSKVPKYFMINQPGCSEFIRNPVQVTNNIEVPYYKGVNRYQSYDLSDGYQYYYWILQSNFKEFEEIL